MDRRRFLKYAGATAAVVGASALGLDYLLPTQERAAPNSSSTLSSSTSSVIPSTSTTSAQLSSLSGRLFFDYNGNGIQDAQEPAVSNAKVRLGDGTDKIIAESLTDSSGDYKLEDVPVGSYLLKVDADKKFRYMCKSANEFRAITDAYPPILNELSKVDVGWMEGFLTLPFKVKQDPWYYVDLDPSGALVDWKGGSMTYKYHRGTDFLLSPHTPTFAAAPGIVNEIMTVHYDSCGNGPPCTATHILISHLGEDITIYDHMERIDVQVGQFVSRGDQIGLVGYEEGDTLSYPGRSHIHFEYDISHGGPKDPFRDLHYSEHPNWPRANSVTMWTKDNDPQYSVT